MHVKKHVPTLQVQGSVGWVTNSMRTVCDFFKGVHMETHGHYGSQVLNIA